MLNYSSSIRHQNLKVHTLPFPLKPSIRHLNCCKPLNLKPIFYGIEFFYDDEKKIHRCELKMETIVYTGVSDSKENAYNKAKQKYLVNLKQHIKKPEKEDYLLENKFEIVNRFQKNSMSRRNNRQHKSDCFENNEKEDVELPEILVGTKYDHFNLGTDERPIVLRRGKKPKNQKNYK